VVRELKKSLSKVIKAGKTGKVSIQSIPLPLKGEDEERSVEGVEEGSFSALSQLISSPQDLDEKIDESSLGEVEDATPAIDPLEEAKKKAIQEMERAQAEAERIRSEAEEILTSARKRAEEIESRAYDQGFSQGRKDGEELGRKQYEAMAQRLKYVIEALEKQGNTIFAKYEAQIVQLTIEAAKHIVGREIKIDPSIVLECLKSAMDQVVEGSHLRIHLHPKDVELVSEFIRREQKVPGNHPIDLIPDTTIERGGCFIETEFGLVDATMESKWQAVSDAMKKILEERTGLKT